MNIKRSSEIAEVVGFCFGDGSLIINKKRNKLRFQLRGHSVEDRDHYNNYIIPLFNKNLALPLLSKEISIVESKKTHKSYGIYCENNDFGNFLSECGVPTGKKKELIIPSWIKKNRQNLICFLRGFFDTDGTIFCQKNYSLNKVKKHTQIRLKLITTSKMLAEDLKQALDFLEMKSFLKIQKKRNSNEKTAYYVEIDGGINIDEWFRLISSNNPKHITKYQIWKKFGFCPPYTTLKQRRDILKGKLDPFEFYV